MALRRILALASMMLAGVPSVAGQSAQSLQSDALIKPNWYYGSELFGGLTVHQVTSPNFLTANRNVSNIALVFHAGRVLTHEHGRGLVRGTFEWDVSVIPVEIFFVLGSHYAGGFEPVGFRWNFTRAHRRFVPYAGVAGGLLFSPENFPPGDTYQMNFTVAIDAGVHWFVRNRRSVDLTGRVFHLSNAFLGPLNPGIPVGLQFTVGYSWY